MNDIQNLTAGELRKILSIKEQIEELQSSPKKIFAQICKAAAAGLSRTVLGVAVVTMTLTARAQVNFCTEIQTANSSSISYDSGLFTYTESDASEGEEHAILPLCGDAASAINSTSAWTASVSVNLSARTFAAATSHAEMGFVVSTSLSGSLEAHKRKDGTGVFVIVRHELALQPGLAVWEAFHDPKDGQVKLDGETLSRFRSSRSSSKSR
jgi:hypothetical protein